MEQLPDPRAPGAHVTPLGDAIARVGQSGEGLSVDVTHGSDAHPTVSAGGWVEWGKQQQFGFGGAVQKAKDAWAAAVKFVWKPGGLNDRPK